MFNIDDWTRHELDNIQKGIRWVLTHKVTGETKLIRKIDIEDWHWIEIHEYEDYTDWELIHKKTGETFPYRTFGDGLRTIKVKELKSGDVIYGHDISYWHEGIIIKNTIFHTILESVL